jgi:hypothetical protein
VGNALATFGSAASPYYQSLWNTCTEDERLALYHLAEEGVVNPQNQAVVRDLATMGLVVRDPVARIMNVTFRDFVLQAASASQVSEWEQRGIAIPWASVETAMWTVVAILAVLLILTQDQLLDAWVGFIPIVLPPAKQMINIVAGWWPSSSKNAVTA